jgi:hypothetical protein
MSGSPARIAPLAAMLVLAACATGPGLGNASTGVASAPEETITIALGPCFGFCPVYETSIAPYGGVRFDGQRHTAVLGERTRNAGASVYTGLKRDLAPFRPAAGTQAEVDCTAEVSDTSPYTVTWTDPAGRQTIATVQGGCPGEPGQALVQLLRGVPERLGIAEWARQTTRRGTSRG